MTHRIFRKSVMAPPGIAASVLAACLLLWANDAAAQEGEASSDKVRSALGKQEGDVDSASVLKDALSAKREYSLIPPGKTSLTYDATYTYISRERINANFSSGTLTLFNISNENQHTLTNTLSAEYGVLRSLTATGSLPIISTYSQRSGPQGGVSHSLGDISMGLRWQPFGLSKRWPSATLNTSLRMPSGRSPFEGVADTGQATGSGLWQGNLGVSLSKVVDPVALFGSVNFGFGRTARGLSQPRTTGVLQEVQPGQSVGVGFGMAHALSYDVSTSVSFQETWSRATRLRFQDGTVQATQAQTAGMLSFGLGLRASPQTVVNLQVGIGLTADSPNFTLGMNVPLQF